MIRKILQRLRAHAAAPIPVSQGAQRAAILDQYVRTAPSVQNALDVFRGEWWTAFPDRSWQSGRAPHFEDDRIVWAIPALGGVAGKRVLELGPMEGGQTWMLEKAGAECVIAVEANIRAYLKCLITKELMGMQRSRFLLGDFEEYLRTTDDRFDAVIACGVIYHMRNPVETIHNIARVTDRVYVWTHYFIRERVEAIPHMQNRFGEARETEHLGFRHTLNRYNYGDFLDTSAFAGGSEAYSNWLGREDLLGALRHAGFTDIRLHEDQLDHVNGPCLSLVAFRPH
jgi:ubiquinone/menaquinone biosynthesis C-methylase UbiE